MRGYQTAYIFLKNGIFIRMGGTFKGGGDLALEEGRTSWDLGSITITLN